MFGTGKKLNRLRKGGLRVAKGAVKSINLKKLATGALKGMIASNPYLQGIAVGWKMLKAMEKNNPNATLTIEEAKAIAAAEFQKGRIYERNLINSQRG